MLIDESYEDPMQAKGVEVMVEYGLNEGQAISPQLGYVALPDSVCEKVAAVADGLSPDYTITLE